MMLNTGTMKHLLSALLAAALSATNCQADFELILVSSDRDTRSMLDYAAKAQIPWPQIEIRKVRRFRSKFDHGVTGIPSVVVCDLQGNRVPGNFRDLTALANLVK